MKIAIVGAGIIGVTTAYELAIDGHQVTVFEQQAAVAEQASFAPAGLLLPDELLPWPVQTRLAWPLAARELTWLWQRRRAHSPAQRAAHHAQLQHLADYSRERLHQLSASLPLSYEHSVGSLLLLRSAKELKQAEPALQRLREAGLACRTVDAVEARRIEPALSLDTPLAAAVHWPDDEAGNCRQFAQLLKHVTQRLGATFEFQARITQLGPGPAALTLAGESTPHRFDAVVLCAGLDSARLLAPLGLRLPLVAVRGYSVSAPVREPLNAPRSTIRDARHQVTVSRLGQRVRVAGGAELGGRPGAHRDETVQRLYQVLHDWFPGAARLSSGVQVWKGARPTLPDGRPLIGASGLPGLWLNLGHGSAGWALACGSARALADQIGQRPPEIDLADLGPARLRR